MSNNLDRYRDYARIILAGIRIVNGALALFLPELLAKRLAASPDDRSGVIYALRLFGVRTIVIGIELLQPDEHLRAWSLRYGVAIHASDVAAAALGGVQQQLQPSASIMLTVISTINTALAVFAQKDKD